MKLVDKIVNAVEQKIMKSVYKDIDATYAQVEETRIQLENTRAMLDKQYEDILACQLELDKNTNEIKNKFEKLEKNLTKMNRT